MVLVVPDLILVEGCQFLKVRFAWLWVDGLCMAQIRMIPQGTGGDGYPVKSSKLGLLCSLFWHRLMLGYLLDVGKLWFLFLKLDALFVKSQS
jgi:hypothetical protein